MIKSKGLIILDRDGVLNQIVIDPVQGTIDSPLHPSQVKIIPGVPEALKHLCDTGYGLAIATNQPSAAKRKTTQQNLEDVHRLILNEIQAAGAVILSSHVCYHCAEDGCNCRKPKYGLLKEAFEMNPSFLPENSWMVGDGVTDVQAGLGMGLKTAFLGPKKCDACKVFDERVGSRPLFWGRNLTEFVQFLLRS